MKTQPSRYYLSVIRSRKLFARFIIIRSLVKSDNLFRDIGDGTCGGTPFLLIPKPSEFLTTPPPPSMISTVLAKREAVYASPDGNLQRPLQTEPDMFKT